MKTYGFGLFFRGVDQKTISGNNPIVDIIEDRISRFWSLRNLAARPASSIVAVTASGAVDAVFLNDGESI